MKNHTTLSNAMLGFVCTAFGIYATAGVITVSSTAPTVDGDDISMLDMTGAVKASAGDPTDIWSNRPAQGQTFLTGSTLLGYNLSAITLVTDRNISGENFTVRVGQITGSDFNLLAAESWNGPITSSDGDYVTFALDTPVTLAADTTYGFDWGTSGDGFIPYYYNSDVFPDGQAYISGSGGSGGSTITAPPPENDWGTPKDRVFHLDIAAIPEPSTLILMCVSLASLLAVRRWNRN